MHTHNKKENARQTERNMQRTKNGDKNKNTRGGGMEGGGAGRQASETVTRLRETRHGVLAYTQIKGESMLRHWERRVGWR
jgi:hypothetical protein